MGQLLNSYLGMYTHNVELKDLCDVARNIRWVIFPSCSASQSHVYNWPHSKEKKLNGQHLNPPFFLHKSVNPSIKERFRNSQANKNFDLELFHQHHQQDFHLRNKNEAKFTEQLSSLFSPLPLFLLLLWILLPVAQQRRIKIHFLKSQSGCSSLNKKILLIGLES